MTHNNQPNKALFIGAFSTLCLILIGVLGVHYWQLRSDKTLRSVSSNTAKAFRYRVTKRPLSDRAGKDFEPGYYDVTVTRGRVYVNGFLTTGQRFQNSFYGQDEHLSFSGKGTVSLKPARLTPLHFKNDRVVLKDTYGSYVVGKELAAGTYTLKWTSPETTDAMLLIAVHAGKSEERSVDLKQERQTTLKLAKNQVLEIGAPRTRAVQAVKITIAKQS